MAFKANGNQRKCSKCNKFGHLAKYCKYKFPSKDKNQVRCFKCNKNGHIAKYCREEDNSIEKVCNICKKNNHNEKDCYFRNKKQNKSETANKVALLTSEMDIGDIWIVNSGSSSHLTNKRSYFKELQRISITINVAKSKETMEATGIGIIEFDEFKLKEVLYVPNLSSNLLSIHSVMKNGGEVIFKEDEVIIKVQNKVI